jgi:hypothetical protein
VSSEMLDCANVATCRKTESLVCVSHRKEAPAASISPEILVTAFIPPDNLITIEEARRLRPDLPPQGIHGCRDKQARRYRQHKYRTLQRKNVPRSNAVKKHLSFKRIAARRTGMRSNH